MGVVVDSSVIVAVQRRRFDWRAFAGSLGNEELFVTTITLSEMLHGAHRAQTGEQREKRLRFADRLERDYRVLTFAVREAHTHAALSAELQMRGETVGAHDLLIAGIALCHGHRVATLNVRVFSRVPGLGVVDASGFVIPEP